MVQGELEMKKGSDGRKCLHYLDRAVELNDYDEAALVARSRSAGAAVIFRYSECFCLI